MNTSWRGIFPIVVTPFTKGYELDEPGLRKVVRFCIDAGARGLVGPANASEYFTLSDDERRRWIEIVAGENSKQIPFIVSITSGHSIPALALGKYAQQLGADCVMSIPPYVVKPDATGCFSYYKTLANKLEIPIMVQNCSEPIGVVMSPNLLGRLCREIDRVEYIKEETAPSTHKISADISEAGKDCKGVYGGNGGIHLVEEYIRGVIGNMPGCQTTDILQTVWDMLEAGDNESARGVMQKMLPLINMEHQLDLPIYKEILCRRGVFKNRICRASPENSTNQTLMN